MNNTAKGYTDYRTAAHWLSDALILCNNISEIDGTIWDNLRFDLEDEEGNFIDIYQWFLTDLSETDVEYMEATFGLKYTYSDKLDLFILCVDHFGTAWSGVLCEVYSDTWLKHNKLLLK